MSRPADDRLRPLALYEAMYANRPRTFAIPTTTDAAEWDAWRAAFRSRLRERLGGLADQRVAKIVSAAEPTEHAGYRRSYIEFESAPGVRVPAWLLVPTGLSAPAPAVIAVHGHGYGADALVGINPDGTERAEPDSYHQDFALALCRRGMVVIAPELRAFGRRRETTAQQDGPSSNSCHEAAWWGIMLGQPLLGSRVWDVLCALDVLEAVPGVDHQRIGIMGGSGGGATASCRLSRVQRITSCSGIDRAIDQRHDRVIEMRCHRALCRLCVALLDGIANRFVSQLYMLELLVGLLAEQVLMKRIFEHTPDRAHQMV